MTTNDDMLMKTEIEAEEKKRVNAFTDAFEYTPERDTSEKKRRKIYITCLCGIIFSLVLCCVLFSLGCPSFIPCP